MHCILWRFKKIQFTENSKEVIIEIYYILALICASCRLACVPRAVCPPQVVFCFLRVLLEFPVSKHESIFLLHALAENTNSVY